MAAECFLNCFGFLCPVRFFFVTIVDGVLSRVFGKAFRTLFATRYITWVVNPPGSRRIRM